MRPSPFDLNPRHLRALSPIIVRGSMSAAAESVGLSQPALTQGIAKLEHRLGTTLFERHADGMTPTYAGIILAERADAAILHLANAVRVVRQILRDSDFLTLLSPDQVGLEIDAGMLTTIGPAPEASGRVIGVTTRAGWRPTRVQARFLEVLAAV